MSDCVMDERRKEELGKMRNGNAFLNYSEVQREAISPRHA